MKVLVTGGAGYIGSHTVLELVNSGIEVIVVDNLSNSSEKALKRIKKITGKKIVFYKEDLLNTDKLDKIFKTHSIESVIHFAGLKAVGESVQLPLKYYKNNVCATVSLLSVMRDNNVKKIIFSSSATVYGNPETVPIPESAILAPASPYGKTKYYIEQMLGDLFVADKDWSIVILRYFNPIGAHESGEIGEDPNGIPNNLLPFISQVAVGKLDKLKVYGDDYPTPDGTGIRDYIHVVDLARGHIASLKKMNKKGFFVFNLGTGKGTSVMEIIKSFEKACGKKILFEVVGRRDGDVTQCFADVSLAERELGWKARFDIDKMCKDTWNWQRKNPEGYGKTS